MFRKIFLAVIILTIFTTACGIHVELPIVLTPGPTVVDKINIPPPVGTTDTVNLSLAFGAGKLTLSPGSSTMVSGTVTYNIADFKPEVTISGRNVQIKQGEYQLRGIPDMSRIVNDWELSLGSVPVYLKIEAGAYQGEYEFGGLSLTDLTIQDGAADVSLSFSEPNQIEMGMLRYSTGASSVTMTGLANANFSMMEFECGAGNYTLDFSGELQRDASVSIETGVSNLVLVIPEGVQASVTVESGLSNISVGSGWQRGGDGGQVYTQDGSGPSLTIFVKIGAGNLTLSH